MSFRLRPSSKKSTDIQSSLVQFPKPQTFITNEIMTLKQLSNKVEMLQTSVNILTQGIRRQRDISSAGYIQVQKRLDVLEYKTFANQKDIQQLADINRTNNTYGQLPALKKQPNESSLSKNQVIVLKQTLLQQRQSQKEQSKYMSQTLQQLSIKQLRLEQELREMFNKIRAQYEQRMSQQTQQLQRVDTFKLRKMDNQYEIMRESMQVMERRIVEELEAKLRKEMLIKEYVQEQVNLVKQELVEEQRSLVSTEVKLTREMKQSLESLYAMIGQMKLTFGQELTETQQLTSNNIKRLAMNLDVIDGKYQERVKQIEEETKENEKEMVNFRQWVVGKLDQNRDIVMGLEEEAIQRLENSQGKSNNMSRSQNNGEANGMNGSHQSTYALQQRFKYFQNSLQSWKSSIQQKNLSIFKQISQTLKQIKLDYKKQNDEVSSELISLTESLKQLKKSLPNDMKKISQTIVTIFNDEFDVLAQELDLLTEMIKVAKGQGEIYAKNEIKKHKEEFLEEIKTLVQGAKKQVTLSLQKSIIKSQQSYKTQLQKQSQFLTSLFNQRLQRLESTTEQLQTQSKKLNNNTTAQLQNFTLSMKQFNENYKEYLQEERKDDLKKRIELQENMRKNASNLMDIAYKKSEFLVEGMKKAIEMSQMKKDLETKQAIEGVKGDLNKANQQQKQQLFMQLKTLQNKLQSQRKSSEQQLQESLKESITTLKKTLGIQIGNSKLQIQQKINGIEKEVEQKFLQERQSSKKTEDKLQLLSKQVIENETILKKSEQKLQTVRKQLSENIEKLKSSQKLEVQTRIKEIETKIAALQKSIAQQTKVQLTSLTEKQAKIQQNQSEVDKTLNSFKKQHQAQKTKEKETSKQKLEQLKAQFGKQIQKQFEESAQKSQQELKEYEETLNTLRETVWKLEAMNFSQQAKNKAIFDKINEDLNHITVNLDSVSKQIKSEQQKKTG